jgi:hypothetical protein
LIGGEVTMVFFYGILFLSVAAVLFSLALIGFRKPQRPLWADGYVSVSLCVMVIISFFSTGIVLMSFAGVPGLTEALLSAGVAVLAGLLLWGLRVPRRLAEYAAEQAGSLSSGQVVELGAAGAAAAPGRKAAA